MARVLVRRPRRNWSNSSKGVQCVHSARDVAMEHGAWSMEHGEPAS